MTKNNVTITTIVIAILAVLLGAATFLIKVPEVSFVSPLGVHLFIAIPLAYTVFHFEAVWLFILGLRHFKTTLRRSYLMLIMALVLLGVAQFQIPVIGLLEIYWWINVYIDIPYVAATILFFTSIRSFARLLDIKGFLTSWWPLVLTIVIAVTTALLSPAHTSPAQPTDLAARVALGSELLEIILSAIAAINILRISMAMSIIYNSAMRWLFVAIMSYAVAQFQYLVIQLVGYDNPLNTSGLSNILFFVSGLLFVRAGYAFWRLGIEREAHMNVPVMDVVTYTANLATNPRVINPILDRIRTVSIRLAPNAPLAEEDQAELGDVYLELENYLTQKEPLRSFTQEGLRKQIARMFPHDKGANPAFWSRLT